MSGGDRAPSGGMVAGGLILVEVDAMVEAIRDQWVIAVALVIVVGLVAWLWGGRTKTPRP